VFDDNADLRLGRTLQLAWQTAQDPDFTQQLSTENNREDSMRENVELDGQRRDMSKRKVHKGLADGEMSFSIGQEERNRGWLDVDVVAPGEVEAHDIAACLVINQGNVLLTAQRDSTKVNPGEWRENSALQRVEPGFDHLPSNG